MRMQQPVDLVAIDQYCPTDFAPRQDFPGQQAPDGIRARQTIVSKTTKQHGCLAHCQISGYGVHNSPSQHCDSMSLP